MDYSHIKITRRDLPHWELDGATYFVTFSTWEKLELTPPAQQVVFDACRFFDQQRYQLYALVVMPDHVHLLIQPFAKPDQTYWSLSSILHSIKGYSAKQIPKAMAHLGIVWQAERYDRIIRNPEEFHEKWDYIRQNPVKAGLSDSPEQYPFFWQHQ